MTEREDLFRKTLFLYLDRAIESCQYDMDAYDIMTSQFVEKNLETLVKDYQDILESYI